MIIIYNCHSVQQFKQRLSVARKDSPADLLLTGGRLINVFSGEIINANIAIVEGMIAAIGPEYTDGEVVINLENRFVCPGLIDAHLHVESTLLMPPELSLVICAHGTTTVIHDPHEIANVLGIKGVEFMLEASENLPCDFFATAPSCVPATSMETAGGKIDAAEVALLLERRQVVGLGEVMNYPGIINGDDQIIEKIIAAQKSGKIIDGHAPGVEGPPLQAYLSSGITTDHEAVSAAEAAEKLQNGMRIIVRHGSATSNLAELLPLVNTFNNSSFMFGSDDREAGELLEKGHINDILRTAVALGGDPLMMIKIASYNAARHYRLFDRGAVAAGYRADLAVFDDLVNFKAMMVIKNGEIVARGGKPSISLPRYKLPQEASSSVMLPYALNSKNFFLPCPTGKAPVIGVIQGQLITEKLFVDLMQEKGTPVSANPLPGINKIAVIERHGKNGGMTVGLIKGIGLMKGAIASSVAHDSHNIIVVGASEAAMAVAVNELGRIGGGFVVTGSDLTIKAVLPLPAAGLMSNETASTTAKRMCKLLTAARELGTELPQPFLTLAFMALPVIPSLKITDRGLVDVDNFTFLQM